MDYEQGKGLCCSQTVTDTAPSDPDRQGNTLIISTLSKSTGADSLRDQWQPEIYDCADQLQMTNVCERVLNMNMLSTSTFALYLPLMPYSG